VELPESEPRKQTRRLKSEPGRRSQWRSSRRPHWRRYGVNAHSPNWLSSSMHIRTGSRIGSDNFRSVRLMYSAWRNSRHVSGLRSQNRCPRTAAYTEQATQITSSARRVGKHHTCVMQTSGLSLRPVAQRVPARRMSSMRASDLRVAMVHHKPDRRCRHRRRVHK